MASTLCQKLLITFCHFLWFGSYDFVQISPSCDPNTYQIIYGGTLDFQYHYQQWQHKMQQKINIFAVNLPLKLFLATVANADMGSLKSLHTIPLKMFVHMLVRIWTKSYGPNYHDYTKFWAFWQKKPLFFITIFDKELTPFWKTFL